MMYFHTISKNTHPVPLGIVGRENDFRDAMAPFAGDSDVILRYYQNGRDVLRRVSSEWNAVWIIDLLLEDMSAFDLLEMIRDRLRGVTVCMVGSRYNADDEMNAYRAGATLYSCHPLQTSWLRECIKRLLAGRDTRKPPHFSVDPTQINSNHSIGRKNNDSISTGLCRGNGDR